MTADVNLYLSSLLTMKTMNNNESIALLLLLLNSYKRFLMINNARAIAAHFVCVVRNDVEMMMMMKCTEPGLSQIIPASLSPHKS